VSRLDRNGFGTGGIGLRDESFTKVMGADNAQVSHGLLASVLIEVKGRSSVGRSFTRRSRALIPLRDGSNSETLLLVRISEVVAQVERDDTYAFQRNVQRQELANRASAQESAKPRPWNERGVFRLGWVLEKGERVRESYSHRPNGLLVWEQIDGDEIQADLSVAGDYVISHRVKRYTVSYRPEGEHVHVGTYPSLRRAKVEAQKHCDKRRTATGQSKEEG